MTDANDISESCIARSYADEQDLTSIFDLLVRAKDAGYVDVELRTDSLRVVLTDSGFDSSHAVLVELGDALIGFGVLWWGRNLAFFVDPDVRGSVETGILDWACRQVRQTTPHTNAYTLCRSDDLISRGILESAGYVLFEKELRMVRSLGESIEEPAVPDGFTIRPLAGFAELPAWIALYDSAFGTGRPTVKRRPATLRDQDYDASLDLIAIDGEGNLAAMCANSIARYEAAHCRVKEGRMGPVAVEERYRRLGLGRAMVLTGLRILRDNGVQVAVLETDSDNLPAHRLYESVGYQSAWDACWYRREL